jgi:hypothetical protein
MKETIKLKQTFIKMIDKIIIDLPAVERHLEGIIQMFLQFNKKCKNFDKNPEKICGHTKYS